MGNPRVQIMSRELVCSTQNRQQRSTLFATIVPRRKRPVDGAMVISRSCARVPHARPMVGGGLALSSKGLEIFPRADFAILSWYYSDKPNHRTLYTLNLFSGY